MRTPPDKSKANAVMQHVFNLQYTRTSLSYEGAEA